MVDDGSKDGTREWLMKTFETVACESDLRARGPEAGTDNPIPAGAEHPRPFPRQEQRQRTHDAWQLRSANGWVPRLSPDRKMRASRSIAQQGSITDLLAHR